MKGCGIKKADSGFTLIEILIAVAISAIVLTALISVFSSQQKTYAQQTDLAKSQASARAALYHMARDVRMAGYTGVPLGVDTLAGSSIYVIRSLPKGHADNPGTGDAIEIWGNFRRATTTLDQNYTSGTVLQVKDTSIFAGSGFSKPGWVLVGKSAGAGVVVEMKTFSTISGTTVGTVTLDSPLSEPYLTTNTIVSPMFKKVYWVDADRMDPRRPNLHLPTLYARNYDNATPHDLELATNVSDLEFFYTSTGDNDNEMETDQKSFTDSCRVRGVTIRLWTWSEKFREENPLEREFSSTVRIRNLGFDLESCPG